MESHCSITRISWGAVANQSITIDQNLWTVAMSRTVFGASLVKTHFDRPIRYEIRYDFDRKLHVNRREVSFRPSFHVDRTVFCEMAPAHDNILDFH